MKDRQLQITIDIPPEVADVYDEHGKITRELLQGEGFSEYQAKIHANNFKKGAVNYNDEGEILKSVLIPDIHHPDHDPRCMKALNQFLHHYQPDEIVYTGDQLTMDCVSSWNKNKPKMIESMRIEKDCRAFDADILQVHEDICPDARRVFMYGNHEERLHWFVEQIPAVEGLVEVEHVLNLEGRGYIVIPYNEIYRIGKLRVIHGFYYNKFHAAKTADAFESNVVYGHVHNYQAYAKISPVDTTDYHMATSLPCMGTLKPAYLSNKPNRYINGFGVVETLIETSNFNLTPIIINDAVFIFGSRVYDGNK